MHALPGLTNKCQTPRTTELDQPSQQDGTTPTSPPRPRDLHRKPAVTTYLPDERSSLSLISSTLIPAFDRPCDRTFELRISLAACLISNLIETRRALLANWWRHFTLRRLLAACSSNHPGRDRRRKRTSGMPLLT